MAHSMRAVDLITMLLIWQDLAWRLVLPGASVTFTDGIEAGHENAAA